MNSVRHDQGKEYESLCVLRGGREGGTGSGIVRANEAGNVGWGYRINKLACQAKCNG